MKNLKYGYFVAGGFGAIGLILYAIVICENIFNKALSPEWIKTVKVWGIISFACALVVILVTLLIAVACEKKNDSNKTSNDEELLAKYKSKK